MSAGSWQDNTARAQRQGLLPPAKRSVCGDAVTVRRAMMRSEKRTRAGPGVRWRGDEPAGWRVRGRREKRRSDRTALTPGRDAGYYQTGPWTCPLGWAARCSPHEAAGHTARGEHGTPPAPRQETRPQLLSSLCGFGSPQLFSLRAPCPPRPLGWKGLPLPTSPPHPDVPRTPPGSRPSLPPACPGTEAIPKGDMQA